jgi:hypothetical protein
MKEINLGGCIYNYENKKDKYTLYYSHNDVWREDLKGQKAFEIEDSSNGISLNPKLRSKKKLDYSESIELFFLLSKYYENER